MHNCTQAHAGPSQRGCPVLMWTVLMLLAIPTSSICIHERRDCYTPTAQPRIPSKMPLARVQSHSPNPCPVGLRLLPHLSTLMHAPSAILGCRILEDCIHQQQHSLLRRSYRLPSCCASVAHAPYLCPGLAWRSSRPCTAPCATPSPGQPLVHLFWGGSVSLLHSCTHPSPPCRGIWYPVWGGGGGAAKGVRAKRHGTKQGKEKGASAGSGKMVSNRSQASQLCRSYCLLLHTHDVQVLEPNDQDALP